MSKDTTKKRGQLQCVCIEDLVPQNHLLRQVEKAIDFSFIYPLVEDTYSQTTGRPSLDPAVLIKMVMLQHMFGIRSMRQTVKEIEVNNAYRWFLGLDLFDPVPHFTTFGKNYSRRFEATDLFEKIFEHVLEQCDKHGFTREDTLSVDATHIKANANRNKKLKVILTRQAKSYGKELLDEINADRENMAKSHSTVLPEVKPLPSSKVQPIPKADCLSKGNMNDSLPIRHKRLAINMALYWDMKWRPGTYMTV